MITISCQQFVFTIIDLHLAQCLFAQQRTPVAESLQSSSPSLFPGLPLILVLLSQPKNFSDGNQGLLPREREREKLAMYDSCTTQPNHVMNYQIPVQLQHNFAKGIFSSSSSLPWVLELAEALQHTRPRCFAGSRRDAKLTTPQSEEEGTGGDCPQSGTRTCNLSIPDPQSSE